MATRQALAPILYTVRLRGGTSLAELLVQPKGLQVEQASVYSTLVVYRLHGRRGFLMPKCTSATAGVACVPLDGRQRRRQRSTGLPGHGHGRSASSLFAAPIKVSGSIPRGLAIPPARCLRRSFPRPR